MTNSTAQPVGGRISTEALVWIGHDRALIAERGDDGSETLKVLERTLLEPEGAFEARTIHEVTRATRVIVSGPAFARTNLERAYVAITHRPDRIVDLEPTPEAAPV